MQVEEVCFPLFLCQQTMFQGCNVKRRGSGSLGVSWILGAAWSSQLWGPHPIPRTPIPYWEGKCHHEGTVCSGHVGSVGIVWPGGVFAFHALIPPHMSLFSGMIYWGYACLSLPLTGKPSPASKHLSCFLQSSLFCSSGLLCFVPPEKTLPDG